MELRKVSDNDALLEVEENLAVLRGLGALVSVLDGSDVAKVSGSPFYALGSAIQHFTDAGQRALETAMECRGRSEDRERVASLTNDMERLKAETHGRTERPLPSTKRAGAGAKVAPFKARR